MMPPNGGIADCSVRLMPSEDQFSVAASDPIVPVEALVARSATLSMFRSTVMPLLHGSGFPRW